MLKIKKNKSIDDYLFDDCSLCEFERDRQKGKFKPGKSEIEGLKEAFLKAKEKGAYVGGPLFENFENKLNDLYYDAMESLDGGRYGAEKAETLLIEALKIDPNYVQTHIGLVSVYGVFKNKKKAPASYRAIS